MSKKGGFNKAYRRRYFRMEVGRKLRYYKHAGDSKEKGTIYLEDVADVVEDSHSSIGEFLFQLRPVRKGGRTFSLRTDNETDRTEWIKAISAEVYILPLVV